MDNTDIHHQVIKGLASGAESPCIKIYFLSPLPPPFPPAIAGMKLEPES